MLNEFRQHIQNAFPNLLQQPFLIGCSGGMDSVVLAELCHTLGMDFALAHCNFGLRGSESDGDEAFVRQLAENFGVPVWVTHFDTLAYAGQHRGSVQMAARELRYTWFADVLAQEGYSKIVLAHHADDNLETFLINLSRGTGIQGLLGMPEETDQLCRPLLPFSRAQILEYAQKEGVKWREDSSNADTKYLRNNIRHQIIPLLKDLHPSFLANFLRTQEQLGGTDRLAQGYVDDFTSKHVERHGQTLRIPLAPLEAVSDSGSLLYRLLHPYGFTDWEAVQQLRVTSRGKQILSHSHRLIRNREALVLAPLADDADVRFQIAAGQTRLEEPLPLKIETVDTWEDQGSRVLWVDKEKLNFPLFLRKWKQGDYFYPLGMGGRKLVSKYFKDQKLDTLAKEGQWLLCSGDAVVWIVGQRPDKRFKVGPQTHKILKITWLE